MLDYLLKTLGLARTPKDAPLTLEQTVIEQLAAARFALLDAETERERALHTLAMLKDRVERPAPAPR